MYVINAVDNTKYWFSLKSRHNLTVHSIYLPQMKVSLFCTGHTLQVHDMSCTICDCDDRVNLSLDSLTYSVMSWSPVSCINGRGPMTPLPPSLSLSIIVQKQINWMFLNRLSPIIIMHILHTVLCTFRKVLTRRMSLTISGWWSFILFLWPWWLIQEWYCREKFDADHSLESKEEFLLSLGNFR